VDSAVTTIGWASHADAGGGLRDRAFAHKQLDVMTGAVVTLLGIGIVIALVGIGNTLGLSVLERQREHAVLRALGLTRRQMAGTLAAEAILLATVAGVLGTALGAAYAWIAVQAVVGKVLGSVSVVLPVRELVLLVLAAAAAGLTACLLPARRAARTPPAQGLNAD
jgi:putative ABC transport system permease protein